MRSHEKSIRRKRSESLRLNGSGVFFVQGQKCVQLYIPRSSWPKKGYLRKNLQKKFRITEKRLSFWLVGNQPLQEYNKSVKRDRIDDYHTHTISFDLNL